MNRFERFIYYWPGAWADMVDAIFWIITLAQWKPNLSAAYISWMSKRMLVKTNKERQRVNDLNGDDYDY